MSLLDHPAAPFIRRLGAATYDLLIVVALLMVATFVAMVPNEGKAVPAGTAWFQFYLLLWLLAYFGYCWTVGGQTVGMRAWQLQLVDAQGQRLSWTRSAMRMCAGWVLTALAGVHVLWCLFDPERQGLADRWVGTRMVWARR